MPRKRLYSIRQRVKELTPRARCHADIRGVIASLDPCFGAGEICFRTGNAAKCFDPVDS